MYVTRYTEHTRLERVSQEYGALDLLCLLLKQKWLAEVLRQGSVQVFRSISHYHSRLRRVAEAMRSSLSFNATKRYVPEDTSAQCQDAEPRQEATEPATTSLPNMS